MGGTPACSGGLGKRRDSTTETAITPTMMPSDHVDREVAVEQPVEDTVIFRPTKTSTMPRPYFSMWNLSMAPAQHEVEVAQAQDGEDVRGEDDQRLLGEREDGGHGVHREDDVGHLQEQQGDEERRGVRCAPSRRRKNFWACISGVTGTNRRKSRIRAFSSGSTPCSLANIMRTPVKTRKAPKIQITHWYWMQGGADGDEDRAEDERAQDAEEEHAVLVLGRDREVVQHHHEHEDVVDGERVLDHVAGQELERGLPGRLRRVEARDGQQPRVRWRSGSA